MNESALTPSHVDLLTAQSAAEFDALRAIFREYAISPNIDLSFQDFEQELMALPGEYAAPRGTLLHGRVDGAVAGCCALRPLDTADYPSACEIKRLHVRPAFRCLRLGRQLAEAILDPTRVNGYDHVLLDTLDDMEAARALYTELGFAEIPPHYYSPIAGAHYLMVTLSDTRL